MELLKEFKFFTWRGEDFRDGLIGLFPLPTVVSHVINLAVRRPTFFPLLALHLQVSIAQSKLKIT